MAVSASASLSPLNYGFLETGNRERATGSALPAVVLDLGCPPRHCRQARAKGPQAITSATNLFAMEPATPRKSPTRLRRLAIQTNSRLTLVPHALVEWTGADLTYLVEEPPAAMRYINWLISLRQQRLLGPVVTKVLALIGPDIPRQAAVGQAVRFAHRGNGVVIAPQTTIGAYVTIFHQVTIGSADVTASHADVGFGGVVIEDHAIIGAGAKILGGTTQLVVGRGTIVGANAVLLQSTGEYEVWAGVPARRIGKRPQGRRA